MDGYGTCDTGRILSIRSNTQPCTPPETSHAVLRISISTMGCGQAGNRTRNLQLRRLPLYPLSYLSLTTFTGCQLSNLILWKTNSTPWIVAQSGIEPAFHRPMTERPYHWTHCTVCPQFRHSTVKIHQVRTRVHILPCQITSKAFLSSF